VISAAGEACYFHQVRGSPGLGQSTFGKLLIYELCGRLPLHQRPDVLYVYRRAGMPPLRECQKFECEEVMHIELLYGMCAPQLHRMTCSALSIPQAFWNLRNAARPLYVITDTYSPLRVLDEINRHSAWHDTMKLFVHVASTENCAAAQYKDCHWPFTNNHPVPLMSEEDYLLCGYVSASKATRMFLRAVARIGPESDDQALRATTTPEEVIPVLKYMFHLMGGSPQHLLHFAVTGHAWNTYCAYSEDTVLAALDEATRAYRINPELRRAVHDMFTRHIGSYLHHHSLSGDTVEDLFFHEITYYNPEYSDVRWTKYVPRGAVMDCVVRRLAGDLRTAAHLKEKIKNFLC
jgi:hypothetical protein